MAEGRRTQGTPVAPQWRVRAVQPPTSAIWGSALTILGLVHVSAQPTTVAALSQKLSATIKRFSLAVNPRAVGLPSLDFAEGGEFFPIASPFLSVFVVLLWIFVICTSYGDLACPNAAGLAIGRPSPLKEKPE